MKKLNHRKIYDNKIDGLYMLLFFSLLISTIMSMIIYYDSIYKIHIDNPKSYNLSYVVNDVTNTPVKMGTVDETSTINFVLLNKDKDEYKLIIYNNDVQGKNSQMKEIKISKIKPEDTIKIE